MNFVKRVQRYLMARMLPGDKLALSLGVQVGENCRILSRQFGSEPFLIRIGNHVTISTDVTFITHDGAHWLIGDESGRRYHYRRIEIGNDVFVGAGVTLMPGVRIGDRVVIGAGSVVTKSVPSDSVVAGNPARWISSFQDFERRSLSTLPNGGAMRGDDYRARVLSVLDHTYRPNLLVPRKSDND